MISSLFPNVVGPEPSSASEGRTEDQAVTERFREALNSLLEGKIDRSQYSDSANTALTPALLAQTATQLKSLGTVTKIVFLGFEKGAARTIYRYSVSFSSGQTLKWQFILDASDKISGIGSI